jgi:methionyl-tRNA synthetase
MQFALNVLAEVARLLEPVMPERMALLRDWLSLVDGVYVLPEGHLFPRITDKPGAIPPSSPPSTERGTVTLDDFGKLDLRVGRIVSAERVQGADKLLKLIVDLGGETRQIVAGIGKYYEPAELPGREIVVVANLKPAKLRGVESRGMMLAAVADAGKVALVSIDKDVPPGTPVQ